MMHNIVLVMPHFHERWHYGQDVPHPPTGIFSIATYLANAGYGVHIVDANIEPEYLPHILDRVNDRTLFVGFSVMSTQVHPAIQIARILREARPHTPLIWGGVHPTLFPKPTLESPWADGVIAGQGEETALDLANALRDGCPTSDISGFGQRRDGQIQISRRDGVYDIGRLPFPRYDLLDVERYIASDFRATRRVFGRFLRTFTVHSANGCPYPCTFCINTIQDNFYRRYRMKTASRIITEMRYLAEHYGVEYVCFRDENFTMHKRRLIEYLDAYEAADMDTKWYCTVRADYFNQNHLSESVLARMSRDGCISLAVGAESGSPDVLRMLKKGITREQILSAAHAIARYKLRASFSFMIGVPGESSGDAIETMQLAREVRDVSPDSYIIGPFLFRPYPGASLFDRCVEMGFCPPETLEEWIGYDFQELDRLPWLRDRVFWRFVIYYCEAQLYLGFTQMPWPKWPFKLLGALRIALGVYAYLAEERVYSFLNTLYRSMRGVGQVGGDLHLSSRVRGCGSG